MSQNITNIMQTKVISQLDTYNHTALNNSMYVVEVNMNEIPPSGLSIAIKQNSTTIITSIAPASTQSHVSVRAILNCAINDVIGVVVSSASAIDTGSNAIKGILNIRIGSV